MQRGARTLDFTVPAANGTYAPEILYCNVDNDARTGMDVVSQLSAAVTQLPAGATLEVSILKIGGQPKVDGDWIATGTSYAAVGLGALLGLAAWSGVRLRAKSGGTAGTATVHASWMHPA